MEGPRYSPSLTELPSEVVFEHLLPALDLKDIAALSKINKQYHGLSQDETFWRQKTLRDFSFSPSALALDKSAPPGWSRKVYLGLQNPSVFVWGSTENSRLGGGTDARLPPGVWRAGRFIDCPTEISERFTVDSSEGGNGSGKTSVGSGSHVLRDSISIGGQGKVPKATSDNEPSKVGLVDLQAGGWSFTARDMDGGVWVWGQLDGSRPGFRSRGLGDSHHECEHPIRLPLPCQATAINAGRNHLLVLDSDNLIWEMTAWGLAYHHTAPALTSPSYSGSSTIQNTNHIIQLSTGWSHSACLTSSGTIHVWYPFTELYKSTLTEESQLNGPIGVNVKAGESDDLSRAMKWGKVGDGAIFTLDPLPKRPVWDQADVNVLLDDDETSQSGRDIEDGWRTWTEKYDQKTLDELEQVVKIAGGLNFIIALKANGEVWFMRVHPEEGFNQWEYLAYFSSPSISHISAQFESLTTYSTPPNEREQKSTQPPSSVLHTRLPSSTGAGFGASLRPDNLPDLQDRGIIQVALGDYHHVALTSGGEVWTWGQGSHGQLGLGMSSIDKLTKSGPTRPQRVVFPDEYFARDAVDLGPGIQGEDQEGLTKPFAFAIAAAGFHTGALVLGGPKPKTSGIKKPVAVRSDEEVSTGKKVNPNAGPSAGEAGPMPGMYPLTGMGPRGAFRIGFAGRGGFTGPGPRVFEDPSNQM